MEHEIAEGKIPRCRNGQQILAYTERNQLRHRNTWFLRRDHMTTIQVQATNNGELAKTVRKKLQGLQGPD